MSDLHAAPGSSPGLLRSLGSRTTLVLIAAAIAIGALSALAWISQVGRGAWLPEWRAIRIAVLPVIALLTCVNLAIRFLRWQFLLRSIGIRLPIRPSALLFAAGLATIATPASAGELLKPLLLRRSFGTSARAATSVVLFERGLDVLALALLALAAVDPTRAALVLAGGSALLLVLPRPRTWLWRGAAVADRLRQRLFLARALAPSAEALLRMARPGVALPALLLSCLAWAPAGLTLYAAARAASCPIEPGGAIRLFSLATLAGGFSLAPAGVAVTGGLLIGGLVQAGAALPRAIIAATMVRLLTVGLAIAMGLAALSRALRRAPSAGAGEVARHFDDLSAKYEMQLPEHVRDRLVAKKTRRIAARIAALVPGARRGLEVGCGRGFELMALRPEGYRLVGADIAPRQVAAAARAAESSGALFVAADARRLPFDDGAFDFAYVIGSLHHIEAEEDQALALREIARVVRLDGVVLVLETNPRNPIFRIYMGYLFPVLRDIDVGSELWIDPRSLAPVPGLQRAGLEYFSFLPDFLPAWLDRALLPWERRLEASRAAPFSAHYLLAYRKVGTPPSA